MRTLRRCSDLVQFKALQHATVAGMRAAGCFTEEQITCVGETYGGERWSRYYVGSSEVPGIMSNTNPLERFNRSLKEQYFNGEVRLSTELLLLDRLPRALSNISVRRDGAVSEAPPTATAAMLLRAHEVLQKTNLYTHTGMQFMLSLRCFNAE
eukprot:GHVU01140244.1.p1 GENE.GHVU01140244.1~~GHVU01140244.1.p1  ORF type:complete len:153 (+),score=18.97 GHVU01140244.1:737-1195(+)